MKESNPEIIHVRDGYQAGYLHKLQSADLPEASPLRGDKKLARNIADKFDVRAQQFGGSDKDKDGNLHNFYDGEYGDDNKRHTVERAWRHDHSQKKALRT